MHSPRGKTGVGPGSRTSDVSSPRRGISGSACYCGTSASINKCNRFGSSIVSEDVDSTLEVPEVLVASRVAPDVWVVSIFEVRLPRVLVPEAIVSETLVLADVGSKMSSGVFSRVAISDVVVPPFLVVGLVVGSVPKALFVLILVVRLPAVIVFAVVVSELVNIGLCVPELEVPEIVAVVPYSSVLKPLVVELLSMSVVIIEVLISGVVSLPVTTMNNSQFHM